MKLLDLTLPTHPLTGLRAVGIVGGKPVWPIMGGDDTPAAAAQAAAAAQKATDDAATAAAAASEGFPKDTPVAEMTTEQQVAYYKHQSRKHEDRASEYRTAAGGKSAAEVKAGLESAEEARRKGLDAQALALEDAKKEAREQTANEYAPKAARAVFELALSHVEDKSERDEILSAIDVKSVITETGDIDTDKVSRIVQRLAPAGKAEGHRERLREWPNGDRRTDKTSGVAAGRSLFQERHGKKSDTSTSTK